MNNINKNNILGEYQPFDIKTYTTNDNVNMPIIFVEYDDERKQRVFRKSTLHFNPNTGVLTAPSFSGTLPVSTSINITDDKTSSAPQYLCYVAGVGTQGVKIANVSGFVYYPSNNVLSSLGQLAIGSVGWGITPPQSALYVSKANTTDTFSFTAVHIGLDVASALPCVSLCSQVVGAKPYFKFSKSGTLMDGKIEYDLGNNQMNFFVNTSASTCLELKANSVDVEENLNVNTGVVNLVSAGNTNLNFYESSTHRWTWGYNTSSNYIFLGDIANSRDVIQCIDNSNVKINPYAVGDVLIGMNPSSNPSLEVKSTIIETNVDLEVDGDCSVRENFLVGDVSTFTLGHPSTLLKFHTGTSGIDINNASLFTGTGDVPTDGYAFGMFMGSNTGTGASFIQTGIRTFSTGVNISNYDLILQPNWGNVGIGNSAPSKGALHIDRSMTAASVATGAGYLTAGGVVGTWSGGAGPVSIYSARRIWAEDTIIASSDRRIKKNIQYINDNKALNIFRKIKPCNYLMKDEVIYQNKPHWGLIADEVQNIFPEAVSNTTNHIPNIYQLCNYKEGHLIFNKEIDINEGDFNFKIINSKEHKLEFNGRKVSKFSIKLLFKTGEEVPQEDEKLFCYGYEVDDFQAVEYQAITSLAYGALQEVDRIQQINISKIQKLEEENTKLKNEIELIKQHLNLT